MRSTLIIFICLILFVSGNSQNLYKGKLVSGLTGKPIRAGHIEFNNKLLATTDTLGNFTIELDSANNIALIFYSTEIGWTAIDDLQFNKNDIRVITLAPECLNSAEKDIKENKIKLFRAGGAFIPLPTKIDHDFEKQYKITYYGDGGCTNAIATGCLETYNHTIGIYLDKKYGTKWRKKVSKNVYGL